MMSPSECSIPEKRKVWPSGERLGPREGEQVRKVRNLVDFLSANVEVIEGIVPGGAFDEVRTGSRRHPAYVGGYSRDGTLVAAIHVRRPNPSSATFNSVEKHTRTVH
jgi:hypothetical protein